MLGKNLSLHFYLKKPKKYESGPIPVYLRITMDNEVVELCISRKCEEKSWDRKAQKVIGKNEETRELNHHISTFRMKAFEARLQLIEQSKPVTANGIRNLLTGREEKTRQILEVFQHHNDQMAALVGKEFSDGTLERYQTSIKHTRSFIKWKYGVQDMPIQKLDFEFVSDYEFWLKSKRACGHNTAIKYIANFRKIVNRCVRNGWLPKDPFSGFKMTKREVERVALTESELQKIIDKDFGIERLSLVRDIFIFCCFTGLAYADVKKLKRNEIAIGIDGGKWIFTSRQKTEAPSRIPLLPITLTLLDKYKNHLQCKKADKLLPVLSNQKMNSYLKEIADSCEISKGFTFHIARHTFATTVTLGNGVPIETVSKMLGHKNLRTTQHYAKILDKKVSDDMAALRQKLQKVS
ncbi:MAG: site-specific integrase [Chitinophagaceae bacterium]|nr:MAG: site-specific integrase [Chitinophagaceae bacterium]